MAILSPLLIWKLKLLKIFGEFILYLKEIFSNLIIFLNSKGSNSLSWISFVLPLSKICKKLLTIGVEFLKFIERL